MEYLETILKTFPIDIGSTRRIHLTGISPETGLYEVDTRKSPLIAPIHGKYYIIDTWAGREIACHPHLVSDRLSNLCLDAANEFTLAVKEMHLISDNSCILHILRGSSGYKVHEVLGELPVINIRTQYTEGGYRAHNDDNRRIELTYSDYHESEFDSLIIPDTFATGRSVETALVHLFDHGISVKRAIIYGFMAVPGIERVYGLLNEHGVQLYAFALCDISQLFENNYDMPLYGLDEYLYSKRRIVKHLGSIVSEDTLLKMIPHYIPGMDQPGDWSERHRNLFNGYINESGDIRGHLQKSIKLIESLDELNRQQPWYTEFIHKEALREIEDCKKVLGTYSLH